MDIDKIKSIVNTNLPDDYKRQALIYVMSKDENIIIDIMRILQEERKSKKALLQDINLELSRAHIYIDKTEPKKDNNPFSKSFIIDSISAFYIKYKGSLTHCFNRFN